MNSEKLKGHILILITNILFAINMPISKYLLPSHVQPEALTIMRMGSACLLFWLTSLFIKREKVTIKDLGLLFYLRHVRGRHQSGTVYCRAEPNLAGGCFHHRNRRPYLRHATGSRYPERADHQDESLGRIDGMHRGDIFDPGIHTCYGASQQSGR